MSEKRYALQVRPEGVGPEWWPKERDPKVAILFDKPEESIVRYTWATTDGASYTTGIDPKKAMPEDCLGQAVDEWYEDHDEDPWPWQFRVIRIS